MALPCSSCDFQWPLWFTPCSSQGISPTLVASETHQGIIVCPKCTKNLKVEMGLHLEEYFKQGFYSASCPLCECDLIGYYFYEHPNERDLH